ncbi:Unknown protein [Striga hermonthica]|uniref:Uncharacterized protein n=1 Tax=Striga hermonthica TaxID=68872 RepID=A0A9N7RNB5_STRHE|nr:Unknown protein [Striga hermonthica]
MKNQVTEDDNYLPHEEESGWTAYLDGFSSSSNCNVDGSFMSSPSLVSDAAWYGSDNHMTHIKRLKIFKNPKRGKNNRRKFSCDDDLTDTASSPVNSPKVSNLRQMEMINQYQRVGDDHLAKGNFQDKQVGSNIALMTKIMEKNGEHNVVDLRQKGLCVVPMSAFIDYFQ